jgi:thymidylate synthase
MLKSIDRLYKELGHVLLKQGTFIEGRNGTTLSLFGTTLKYDMAAGFPILSMRKIYHKGVIGEFKSFLEDAKTVEEFEANGCNYWKLWADEDGSLKLDYPPREQLKYVIDLLKAEPTSRRAVISLWNPANRGKLSLDPCHTQYQFSIRAERLDMIWTQRSVDYAVGAPSDFILAALYVLTIAAELEVAPGIITFNFGDTHLYKEHISEFIYMLTDCKRESFVDYVYNPQHYILDLINYEPEEARKFVLKA